MNTDINTARPSASNRPTVTAVPSWDIDTEERVAQIEIDFLAEREGFVVRPVAPALYARMSWAADDGRFVVYDGNQDRGVLSPIGEYAFGSVGSALRFAEGAELPNSLFVFDRVAKVRIARKGTCAGVALAECSG